VFGDFDSQHWQLSLFFLWQQSYWCFSFFRVILTSDEI
jgi:hypothetical protein